MTTIHQTMGTVAVYGATGHTGQLVAATLAAAGQRVVLGGRDAAGLVAVARQLETEAEILVADLEDAAALRRLTHSADVVINCAGPFSRSGEPLARAAVAEDCHYLGHSAEPRHVKRMRESFVDAPVAVIPNMSFYGGLADMLASLTSSGMDPVEEVTVAYAVSGWRMTTASRATAESIGQSEGLVYRRGELTSVPAGQERRTSSFTFPHPLGSQTVIEDYPAGEVATIPRHVKTHNIRVLMTAGTFAERDVFTSTDITPAERAQSSFTVAVESRTAEGARTASVQGSDIYLTGAQISVRAASQLMDQSALGTSGFLSPAEAFDSGRFINALPGLTYRAPADVLA